MRKLPWYKREPKAFFDSTAGMSFEQKAAYGLVLDLIYMRGGGLPDDPRYIAGHLGLSVRKWNAIRRALVAAGKLVEKGGELTNPRAELELKKTSDHVEQKAKNARSRGAKSGPGAAGSKDYLKIIPRLSSDKIAEKKPKSNVSKGLAGATADIYKIIDNNSPPKSPQSFVYGLLPDAGLSGAERRAWFFESGLRWFSDCGVPEQKARGSLSSFLKRHTMDACVVGLHAVIERNVAPNSPAGYLGRVIAGKESEFSKGA